MDKKEIINKMESEIGFEYLDYKTWSDKEILDYLKQKFNCSVDICNQMIKHIRQAISDEEQDIKDNRDEYEYNQTRMLSNADYEDDREIKYDDDDDDDEEFDESLFESYLRKSREN